jgi:dolichol-phosphate mannosyltransferase
MADAIVIVPTYNERSNVERVAALLFEHAPSAHLLFVDDHSPDGTGALLDRMAAAEPRIGVLHRAEKQGLGRAYVAGFHRALAGHYRFILEMDADLSHNPADVPRLIEAAGAADVALGSRYIDGMRVINWPLRRLLLSRGAGVFVQWSTGMPFADPTSGFKCYRRAALEALELDTIRSNGYSFQIETVHRLWRKGFRIVEVPITFEERQEGRSKMSGAIVREAFRVVWRLGLRHAHRAPRAPHPASVAAGGRRGAGP